MIRDSCLRCLCYLCHVLNTSEVPRITQLTLKTGIYAVFNIRTWFKKSDVCTACSLIVHLDHNHLTIYTNCSHRIPTPESNLEVPFSCKSFLCLKSIIPFEGLIEITPPLISILGLVSSCSDSLIGL